MEHLGGSYCLLVKCCTRSRSGRDFHPPFLDDIVQLLNDSHLEHPWFAETPFLQEYVHIQGEPAHTAAPTHAAAAASRKTGVARLYKESLRFVFQN